MTDTNKALRECPFCGLGDRLCIFNNGVCCERCEIGGDLGHCVGKECEALAIERWNHRALSPNAVVMSREELAEIKHSMNRAIDMIWREQPNLSLSHIKQALAILSQYGERKCS